MNFHEMWSMYENDFEKFLSYALLRSRCDRFAMKHFEHNTYERHVFESDLQTLNARIVKEEMKFNWDA